MINVGIIGCGYWGPNLIRNFVWIPNANMVLCADKDKKRLERMKQLYPQVETTTEAKALFEDPRLDCIGIATPVFSHYELAKQALLHGKHVFVEKPLAHSVEACASLIKIAEEKRRVLMVGHTFEYTAAVNMIKKLIDSGELGDPLYVNSIRLNLGLFQPDINVCWDLAPHDISILNYVLGRLPDTVNCQGKSHYKEGIEDVAAMTLNYKNGMIAFLRTSWLDPNKIRRITIVGSKKMLVYDDIEPQEKIKIYDKGVDAPPYYDTFGDFQFAYRYGDIHSPRIEDYEPLRRQCEHFVECIENGLTPRSDGYSGLRVVSILEASSKSLKQGGGAVPVVYPNGAATFEV
jgi:predicted dehydrogenase